jgi:hypothetical protein
LNAARHNCPVCGSKQRSRKKFCTDRKYFRVPIDSIKKTRHEGKVWKFLRALAGLCLSMHSHGGGHSNSRFWRGRPVGVVFFH